MVNFAANRILSRKMKPVGKGAGFAVYQSHSNDGRILFTATLYGDSLDLVAFRYPTGALDSAEIFVSVSCQGVSMESHVETATKAAFAGKRQSGITREKNSLLEEYEKFLGY